LRTAVGTKQTKAIGAMLATLTQAKGGKYEAWQFRALANLLDSLEEAKTPLAKLSEADAAETSAKQVAAVISAARTFLSDASAKLEDRAAAVALLGRDAATRKDDLAVLDKLLSPQSPAQLQAAAITELSKRRVADGTQLLLNHWKELTPQLRSMAVDALLSRPESAKLLLDAMTAKKVLVMEIDAPRRQRMLQYPDKTVRARAGELFAQTINANRQKVIDGFAAAATLSGNAKKGKEIFGKTCTTCHRLAGEGNAVGPDLMSVGDKSSQGLLVAILDPNRAVEPRYINYIATTNDDQTLTGLLAAESATSITLLGPEGKPSTLQRRDLKDLRSSNTSLMPDGLEAGMTAQDLANLMAFVRAGK
jgi:putative heme-binding domain-containing protein